MTYNLAICFDQKVREQKSEDEMWKDAKNARLLYEYLI